VTDISLEALESSSVHERAEVLRELGLHGGLEHLERLMEIAQVDDSSAVRLGAAAATADILSRYRVGKRREKLSDARRVELLKTFKSLDPKVNPGLFLVLACVDLPRCLDRIRVGLRDPRWDVRQGAVVGLRRYCNAEAVSSNDLLRGRIIGFLKPEGRLPQDALEGVIGVCAEAGWEDSRTHIAQYSGREGSLGEAVENALTRLDQLVEPTSLHGVWISLGLDAGEVNPNPQPRAWWVLGAETGLEGKPDGAFGAFEWKAIDSRMISVKKKTRWSRIALRRLWLLRSDINVAGPGLQFGGRTYHKAVGEEFLELVGEMCNGLASVGKAERKAALMPMFDMLPEGTDGEFAAACLEIGIGTPAAAVKRMQAMIKSPQKAPPATWYWLAEGFHAGRKKAEATKAWKAYLDKAGKKDRFVDNAKERLGRK